MTLTTELRSEAREHRRSAPPTEHRSGLGSAAAAVLLAIPFAVFFAILGFRAATVDWHPVHDLALIELRVADVGAHTPLLGPYSRFGWSHPGPMLFDLLAVPYRLSGGAAQGLLVGAVLLNAAATAGILALAWRRGGAALAALTAVLLGVLFHALGTDTLMSPWNPWIVLLPTVALFLLAWSLALRDWTMLPITVVVASFVVQTHVGFGLLTVVVLATAGLFAVLDRRVLDGRFGAPAEPRRAPTRRLVVVSAVLGVVLWLPPLIDQLRGTGNLGAMVRFFLTRQPDTAGFRTGAGIVAGELLPRGPWVTGTESMLPFAGTIVPSPLVWLAVPLVALAAALVVAFVRRDRAAFAIDTLAVAATVASVIAIARISGSMWDYLVRFTWVVALFVWLAVLWTVATAVAARVPRTAAPRLRSAAVAGAALATFACLLAIPGGIGGARPPDVPQSTLLGGIEPGVLGALAAHDGAPSLIGPGAPARVLIRPTDAVVNFLDDGARDLAIGLMPDLEQAGIQTLVAGDDWTLDRGKAAPFLFGARHIDDGTEPIAGTLLVARGRFLDDYTPPPGAVEIARVEDRHAVQEAITLEAQLAQEFRVAGHPEMVATIGTAALSWVPLTEPDLNVYFGTIDQVVADRAQPRAAVFWVPGR